MPFTLASSDQSYPAPDRIVPLTSVTLDARSRCVRENPAYAVAPSGDEAGLTNAAALEALKEPCQVHLHTDSRYVIDGITGWIFGWQKNGWKTAAKKPVLNADLWQDLLAATRPHKIKWIWVKGHAGHPENERADKLASNAAESLRK